MDSTKSNYRHMQIQKTRSQQNDFKILNNPYKLLN